MSFFKSLSNILSGKVGASNLLQGSMHELNNIAEKYNAENNRFLSHFYKYLYSCGFSYARREFENGCELPSIYAGHINETTSKYYMQLVAILHRNYYLAISEMERQLHYVNLKKDDFISIVFEDIGVEHFHYDELFTLTRDFDTDNMASFWLSWSRRLMLYVFGQEKEDMNMETYTTDAMIRAKHFNYLYDQIIGIFNIPDPENFKN